eukprot:365942-Chlamydomonas_euryale.AAC.59
MCYNQTLRRATPLSHGAVVSCFGVGRSRKVLTAPRAFPPHSSHASLDLGEALEPEQALYGTALPNFGASSATGASSDEANDSGCCSVLHPGSLSCMFTDVRSTNGQLVLSATATVHDTRHPDHVGKATGLPELEELAWLALKMEAENQISQLEAQCKLPRGGMGRHEHIIHILTVRTANDVGEETVGAAARRLAHAVRPECIVSTGNVARPCMHDRLSIGQSMKNNCWWWFGM